MDIEFYGANCLTLTTKQTRIVIDDTLESQGGKPVLKTGDVAIFTGAHGETATAPKLLLDSPGEYEVAGVSIYGIPARSHLEEKAVKNATIYKIIHDDIRILITGHIYPELSESQLEKIGLVDVLIIPVGGNGYTLDPAGALQLIKKIEPKAVIPTHYAESGVDYEVPQQTLADALMVLSLEPTQTTKKLKIKTGDFAEGVTDLIILERS